MRSPIWFSRFAIAAVAFTLCGGPQLAAAQQTAPVPAQEQTDSQPAIQTTQQQQPSPAATQDQNIGTTNDSATPDPSKGPLKPQDTELPNAPSATRNSAPQQSNAGQNRPAEQPVGAAAAEAAKTSGGAASKPAGTAIAPAKQRQTRSLLIKIGAIAAAGAALGIVYGLSRSSPSTPPGSNTTTSASTAQR